MEGQNKPNRITFGGIVKTGEGRKWKFGVVEFTEGFESFTTVHSNKGDIYKVVSSIQSTTLGQPMFILQAFDKNNLLQNTQRSLYAKAAIRNILLACHNHNKRNWSAREFFYGRANREFEKVAG